MPFFMPIIPGAFAIDALPTRNFHGYKIAIETRKGETRHGKGWSHVLPWDYGYIEGTVGADGDEVDCYLGPNPKSDKIFVVDQKQIKSDIFDEHKCFLGFDTEKEAKQAYFDGHSMGKKLFMRITAMDLDTFRDWLSQANHDIPVEEKYASIHHP